LDAPWPPSFTKNRYDYVLFGDVLEHLKDPLSSLIQAKKLLLPGGKIFVSIPNIAHISIRLELLLGDFEYEETGILDNTHLKYFTKRSFEVLVKNAGLSVIEVNSSLNDYPDEVTAAMLKKIGLTATKDFLKYANSPEARAFQYKFVLGAKKATKSGGNIIKQAQKPEHFRDEYISDLRSQIKNIKDHADEQARIISAQAHQIDVLTGQRSILSRVIARLKK
jgi:SAM-dependent methyltransferase